MNDKLSNLDTIPVVDRASDLLYIVDTSAGTSNKATPNELLGITGNPVGTTDIQTLTQKTLTSPTINTPTLTVNDNALTIQDNVDTTKKAVFELSGITAGQTRTLTVPDASTTLVGTGVTQTLTNKTLTAPTITNPTLTVDTISEFTSANGVTIDGLNIKDSKLNTNNSVVTANITDDAVTAAKMINGLVARRQGGSASSWYTAGTTTFDVSASDVKIQVGTIAVNADPTVVTFPVAFANAPVVVAMQTVVSGANVFIRSTSITATTVNLTAITDGGAVNTAQTACWIAIGL